MIYNGDFSCADDVFGQFEVSAEERKDVYILYASYENEGYDGYAHVLFIKGESLYEVQGSHCSCYGLEGQWDPELVELEVLKGKANRGVRAYGAQYSHFLESMAELIDGSVETLTVKQIAMLVILKG